MKKNTKKNKEVQNEETLQAVQETAMGLAEADFEATSVELQEHRDNPVEAALEDDGAAKQTREKTNVKKTSRAKVSSREEQAEAEASGDSLVDVLSDHSEMEATLEELSREIESAAGLFGESVSEEVAPTAEASEDAMDVLDVSEQAVETQQADAVVAEPEGQTDESVFEQARSDWQDEFASIDRQAASAEMSVETEVEVNEVSVDDAEYAVESTDSVQKSAPTILPQPEPVPTAWDGGQRYARSLMVHHDRGGRIAEEYRSLRTNLLSKCPTDRFCFMVTSAEAGEGKTVTCLNLALVLAERRDRRTIVVDYNLRQGGVAEMLGAKHGPGVAEVVQGRASLEEAIQPTAYPNLFFLSAGQSHAGQAGELMSRSELKSMVETLRDRFDYVLVDTPAVNHYSDAGITGLITGDALLVVRMRKTPKEAVQRAIRSLKATNVNVVGMLLTHRKRHLFN
jgi:capsular exopolysaccharide synthesis family protein